MQAVLYVCHGSRKQEAVHEAIDFTRKCMRMVHAPIQDYCFLELAAPSIQKGIEQCVNKGATKIAIVPVLLLTAAHAKRDIPVELEKAQSNYPNITFTYGQPLGVQEKIIDVLVEKIEASKKATEETHLLLVGRGSRDKKAVEDTYTIAHLLEQRLNIQVVHVCFLAAAKPSFEDKLRQIIAEGTQNTIILPYLLFTGLLMEDIESTVKQMNLTNDQEVTVCDYLGDHKNVPQVLTERVLEAMV